MDSVGVYDQIKTAFQDIIAPELHAIRGDIRVLDQRIVGVDQKIDAVDARLGAKLSGLEQKVEGLDDRLDARIDGVDRERRTAIDIRERLAALEARRSG